MASTRWRPVLADWRPWCRHRDTGRPRRTRLGGGDRRRHDRSLDSSPWVASLPDSPTVPSPRDYFKRIPGAPGELVNSAQAYAYLRALAEASPRVRYEKIGTSEEGRDIVMVAIADEDGIRRLDELKATTARLADPRHRRGDRRCAIKTAARSTTSTRRCTPDETGSTGVGARVRLPPRGVGRSPHCAHPLRARGADKPGVEPGRPRQAGRLVLTVT